MNRLLAALIAPKPQPLPEPDAKLALGALMVRVAKSDHLYRFEEIRRIDRLLARVNGLGPIEAAKMRATCEKLEHAAPDTGALAHLIREAVPHEARIDALEALWEVVLSDDVGQDEEIAVILAAQEALGLSEADSDAARARALDETR